MTGRRELLRLVALTPAHCGAAFGSADLDRPTHKEALHGLPVLPGSTLKGVLAGRWGDQPELVAAAGPGAAPPSPPAANPERERRYGSPDRPGRSGEPAAVVVGDAELLCFPAPAPGCRLARVFPAVTLARALRLAGGADPASLALLAAIEARGAALAAPAVGLAGGVPLPGLDGDYPGRAALLAAARRLAGAVPAPGEPLVIAAQPLAAGIWAAVAERRTLTALDTRRRVVREGFLRTIELIAAGSVFVAPLTLLDGAEPPRPAAIQAGAWEGLGLGWFRLSLVEPSAAGAAPPEPGEPTAPTAPPGPAVPGPAVGMMHGLVPDLGAEPLLAPADLMPAAHAAVVAVAASAPAVRRAARAAVGNFGPRSRLQGLEAALAFACAKAKPYSTEPTPEARAWRWLLGALLLGDPPTLHHAETRCPRLIDWLTAAHLGGPDLAARAPRLAALWLWLRRYAELALPESDGTDPEPDQGPTGGPS